MTGDLIRRLSEQGEREDIGAPDPWIPLGSAVPEFILEALKLEPPTLALQIEAVEAVAQRYLAMAEKSVDQSDEFGIFSAVLDAAAETLRTLDFARETLR